MTEKSLQLQAWYGKGGLDGYLQNKSPIETKPLLCPGCSTRFSKMTLRNHWTKHEVAFGILLQPGQECIADVTSVAWPARTARTGHVLKEKKEKIN